MTIRSRKKSLKQCYFRSVVRNVDAYFFLLPMYALFISLLIVPALRAIYLSLFEFKIGKNIMTFVGLDNFISIFRQKIFWTAMTNTFTLVLAVVPTSLVVGLLIAAAIINSNRFVKAYVRGAFYLPVVVSTVTLSLIWKYIYDPVIGMMNYGLGLIGVNRVMWLADPRVSMLSVIIVIFTFSIGKPIILYMAAIGGIPQSYYEVARIDGATRLQQLWYVTIPLLKPTTLYLMVQGTINMFQTFALIQLMTLGGPNDSTQTLSFLLYQKAFIFGQYGEASAIGTILFIMVSTIALIQYRFLSSDVEY